MIKITQQQMKILRLIKYTTGNPKEFSSGNALQPIEKVTR